MESALLELEHTLHSKKEPLTLQEANVLRTCKVRALRDFTVGFSGGSVATWLATQSVRGLFRHSLSLGAGVAFGMWRFGSSVESSIQHILSLEGSRIQRELATIMSKYHRDPRAMQQLSKHFFLEEVYVDSSADRPIFRWRYRNFSGEPVDHPQITSYNEETHSNKNDVKKTTMEPKQVNTAVDAMENPLDLIFGFSESAENVTNPVEVGTLSRKQMRKEKRSRLRHRRHHRHHHQEESDI